MPIGLGTAAVVSAVVGGAGAAYGAHKQSSTATKAADLQTRANDRALLYQQQQDAIDRAEHDRETKRREAQEDHDRITAEEDRQRSIADAAYSRQRAKDLEDARQGRLKPFQDFGLAGIANLGGRLQSNPNAPPVPTPTFTSRQTQPAQPTPSLAQMAMAPPPPPPPGAPPPGMFAQGQAAVPALAQMTHPPPIDPNDPRYR